MGDTIAALWHEAAASGRARPPFLHRVGESWQPVAAADAGAAVDEVAAGLLDLGVARGDTVALLCRTRVEWALVDFALASLGAVSAPIYPTASPADQCHVVRDSGATVVVCEDASALARLAGVRAELRHAVVVDGEADGALPLDALRERGRALLAARPGAVAEARAAVHPDDLLTLIYTSGTGGTPRGCRITHRMQVAMLDAVGRVPGLFGAGDVGLLFLPLAHTFARTILHALATVDGTVAFCPDVAAIPAALREVRPTILPTTPRLLERVHAAVAAGLARETGAKRAVAEWAFRLGERTSPARLAGRRLPPHLALQHAVADRLVYGKVKARLGGRLRHAISGGAALGAELGAFFHALDVLVLEGYGLTECAVVSVNQPGRVKWGTIGPPLPGVETRLGEDGELHVRAGQVFGGYHADPAGTAEVLDADGWLHTGDVVEQDADGFLSITDRKRDIIVLAGGKNVAPQRVEAALRASPAIASALVVGDGRAYLVALLVAVEGAGAADVQAAVDAANATLGQEERVRRHVVLAEDFSEEAGDLTPTLKLRRRVVVARHADAIERLYAGSRAEA